MVDAFAELFERHTTARFVMIESVRSLASEERLADDRPTTKTFMPGLSPEREYGWE